MESRPRAGETIPLGVPQLELRFNSRIERSLSWLRLARPSGDLVLLIEVAPWVDGSPIGGSTPAM